MPGTLTLDWEPDGSGRDVPAKITVEDFRRYHLDSFPKLAPVARNGLISDAIDTVYAVFTGVGTLWDMQPKRVWHDKTVTCYRLLTAWYIADKYPELVPGVPSIGGLRQKKADGVTLAYDTGMIYGEVKNGVQETLAGLRSNHFGRTALMMIQSAGKRALIRNRAVI